MVRQDAVWGAVAMGMLRVLLRKGALAGAIFVFDSDPTGLASTYYCWGWLREKEPDGRPPQVGCPLHIPGT